MLFDDLPLAAAGNEAYEVASGKDDRDVAEKQESPVVSVGVRPIGS